MLLYVFTPLNIYIFLYYSSLTTEYNHLIMTTFNVPFAFLHNTQTKTW